MRLQKSLFGNKGFVLSFDALIAVFLFTTLLTAMTPLQTGGEDALKKSALSREGSDFIALIDNNGVLDTLDNGEISQELNGLLPLSNIWINITYAELEDGELEDEESMLIGVNPDTRELTVPGKRFFIVSNNQTATHFGVAEYKVWRK